MPFESRADARRRIVDNVHVAPGPPALLTLILGDRLTDFVDGGIKLRSPVVVHLLSGVGVGLAVLSWLVVGDISHHIHRNWRRASAAKRDYAAELRSGHIQALFPVRVLIGFFAVAFGRLLFVDFTLPGSSIGIVIALVAIGYLVMTWFGFFVERPEQDQNRRRPSRPRMKAGGSRGPPGE